MKQALTSADDRTAALLRVATYLGRPQKFMAVEDARAEMRRSLEMVAKEIVILTTHGEPEAAVVPFTTLEDMRCALLHLLVAGMGASLARSQKSVRSKRQDVPTSTFSEEELEKLVGEVVRGARRRNGKSSRKVSRTE
jgi:antitoxin (DNA-binding transcriptional repressor) of toxin-antitoxin stability system